MSRAGGSRALARLSADSTITRSELAEALLTSSRPNVAYLGKLLNSMDDKFTRASVGLLAQRASVTYHEIISCYKDFKRTQAMIAMARELPVVAADIASDAKNRREPCAACAGAGRIDITAADPDSPIKTQICIPCNGKGEILIRGDRDARKQMLEVLELSGRGAVQVDNRGGQMVMAGGDSLEAMLKKSRESPRGSPMNGGGNNVPGVIDGASSVAGSAGGMGEDSTGAED